MVHMLIGTLMIVNLATIMMRNMVFGLSLIAYFCYINSFILFGVKLQVRRNHIN